MNDVLSILAVLSDHGVDLPGRGSNARDHLEDDLYRLLDRLKDDAYANGWDRGYNSGSGSSLYNY